MKNLSNLFNALMLSTMLVFIGCGGTGPIDPVPGADQAKKLTVGTWNFSSVTQDATASTGWDSFTLTFTGDENGGTYSTSGSKADAASVWPASGSWAFNDKTTASGSNTIIRQSDNVSMTINSLSETALTLTFDISGSGSARTSGLDGKWVFAFTQ